MVMTGMNQLVHYAAVAVLALVLAATSHVLDWDGATTAIVGFLLILLYALVTAPLSLSRRSRWQGAVTGSVRVLEMRVHGSDPQPRENRLVRSSRRNGG
jgi:hypothetical protein